MFMEAALREGDRAKFVELAGRRVTKVLNDIRLIGNLSNRSNYDYTEEDVAKIFRALSDEVSACRKKFDIASKKQAKPRFELD